MSASSSRWIRNYTVALLRRTRNKTIHFSLSYLCQMIKYNYIHQRKITNIRFILSAYQETRLHCVASSMAAGWRVYVCTSLNTLFPLRFGRNTQQTSGNKIVMQFLVRCSYTFGFISWKWHAFSHNECYDVCLCMPRSFLQTRTTASKTKTRKREEKNTRSCF